MSYTIKEQKAIPGSQMEFTIEISAEVIAKESKQVLEEAVRDAEMPGFRKGKVPADVIRKRIGELALFEDAATHALSKALADIFKKEELDVIGRPEVTTTKLAPENPAEFKVKVSLFPRLTLPDYKEIAVKSNKKPEESVEVTEKEIDTVLAQITREYEKVHDKKDFIVTDDNVKELGDFASVADLRTKAIEGMTGHKKSQAVEKRRAELLDAIVKATKGDIPEVLIENELTRLEGEFKTQIERMGSTFETYLKEIKKDREAVRKEWRPDAEKRARLHLALAEIARAEKIVAEKSAVEAEVKHILEHYKEAREENVRAFVENNLLNQKTIEFLENQR